MRIQHSPFSFAARIIAVACACILVAACGVFGRHGSVAAGQKDFDAGNYRAAYIEATKVLRSDKKNGPAWLLQGKASLMLGNPHDALGELQQAAANGIAKSERVLPLGETLLVSGQFDKVVSDVVTDKAYPAATNARIDAIRGDALRALKKNDDAKQAYQAALHIEPANARALAGLARLAASTGDVAGAEKFISQSLAATPDNPRALVTRGDLAFDSRNFVAAEADFQKAVDAKQQDWMPQERFYARGRLADAQTRQDKLDDALKNVETLEKLAPTQPYPHYLHAEVLYKQGHMDNAISQLQQVLKYYPDDVPSQMLMGAISYSQGDYGQAEMYFSNVIGVAPENVAARRLLALTYFRAGNLKLATSTLRATVTGNPTDTTLVDMLRQAASAGGNKGNDVNAMDRQLALAGAALGSGNDAEAVRLLEAAKVQGASAEAQRDTMLVMSYLKEHDIDNAVKTAAARATKNPNDAGAHLLYGTTLVAAGKRDEARAQYMQALKLQPENAAVLLSLGSLDSMDGKPKDAEARFNAVLAKDPKSVAAMIALGKLALAQGQGDKGIEWFKRAVGADPSASGPRLQLVSLYASMGKFGEAATTARVWAAAAPNDAAAQNALGVSELNAGNTNAALKALQQAVKLAPKEVLYQLNLARTQGEAKDNAGAKATLAAVIKADPAQTQAVAMLAFIDFKAGDMAGAMALAKNLQQQPATMAAGYMLEGDIYAAAKEWDKAAPAYAEGLKRDYNRALVVKIFLSRVHSGAAEPQQVLQDWLDKHADDVGTRLMLAQYYLTRQQGNPAVAQYEAILKTHPGDITALNNLSWVYSEMHDPKAVTVGAKAYALAPTSPNVLDTYGWALLGASQVDKALPILAKAAKLAPDAPTIQYHLAVAQDRAGDKKSAFATLQGLQKAGDFPEKQAAEKLYKDLGGM